MNIKKAMIKWSISRAADTYGYNVVTLTDSETGKKYKASGGGYDMTGTVFADWMEDLFQDKLKTLASRAVSSVFYAEGVYVSRNYNDAKGDDLYGMTAVYHDGKLHKVIIDGACGLDTVISICKAAGLDVEKCYDRSKRNPPLIAFFVGF